MNAPAQAADETTALEAVVYRYAGALDRFDFEEVAAMIAEDGRYRVIPRRNFDRGGKLYAVDDNATNFRSRCLTRPLGQLEETVHLVGNVVAEMVGADEGRVSASFIINRSGVALFSGEYRIDLRRDGGDWRFNDFLVLIEGDVVPAYIIVPI